MKNAKQSTTHKKEVRYYTICTNIDIETGEILNNTKDYIKINKKTSYERTKTRCTKTITTKWKHNGQQELKFWTNKKRKLDIFNLIEVEETGDIFLAVGRVKIKSYESAVVYPFVTPSNTVLNSSKLSSSTTIAMPPHCV